MRLYQTIHTDHEVRSNASQSAKHIFLNIWSVDTSCPHAIICCMNVSSCQARDSDCCHCAVWRCCTQPYTLFLYFWLMYSSCRQILLTRLQVLAALPTVLHTLDLAEIAAV